MLLLENPVLQRELLVNLRMTRAFVLLFAYVGLLGLVVYAAWPGEQRIDLSGESRATRDLVNMFFLGQYVLMALMAPSFAAGAITGEKERKTYEMLLASPMRPGAIVMGKLLAALAHLAVLVFSSLPIVMLCLPLGGVHYSEVLGTYVAMAASVVTFGMISLAASAYFRRTIAAQVVSYLMILPLALFGVLFYRLFEEAGVFRLLVLVGPFPAGCLAVCVGLFTMISRRLLHPPDVGAEAQEVVDLEEEQREAVGMVIRSDQFPDMLFAPPKRTDLMRDRANPVYDKEMHSELFGQGTLMLRLVIQVSMFLALPLMAVCLYIQPQLAPWYTSYVLVFNMLVGPVFSAGSITSERERQTLELLLTTTVSPWEILWGKLFSGLRVSCVLTSFLVWPLLLAWLLPPWTYWHDTITMVGYVGIIVLSSLTTTTLALFCSVLFRKTTVSMMTAYLVVILLFAAPPAVKQFMELFYSGSQAALLHREPGGQLAQEARFRLTGPKGATEFDAARGDTLPTVANRINAKTSLTGVRAVARGEELWIQDASPAATASVRIDVLGGTFATTAPAAVWIRRWTFTSPFAAAFALPLGLGQPPESQPIAANWPVFGSYIVLYVLVDGALLALMIWLFNVRWRVTY
jgi:ABC-type transport system involved in multi-copper enzyme maturation permease subunit